MNKFQRYLVGTLFDEQEQEKKTNLNNMKAKDPFGNTRWKGAFTGGFEAGYKNTCGSKEGWTPASFVSSVYKRADNNQRTIFDYMDKEDLGRESISQNIVLNNNFDSKKSDGFNITLQQSIGEKILNKLKKMEAHRTAPENQEEMNKLFDLYSMQEETVTPAYHMKDLTQPLSVGAIVTGIQHDDFIEAYENFYRKVIREHAKEETQEEIKKRRQQNRIYFDFTRPLQEQPQYLKQIHEIEEYQKPKKRQKNLINEQTLKHIYCPPVGFKEFRENQEIEKAPQDYDPYARMRGLQQIGQPKPQELHRPKLDADKRGDMLGEVKLSSKFVSSQNSLSNKFISNQKKVEQIKKFFDDQKKNRRFKEYVDQMQGKKISSQLEYMSYEQAEKEREEFDKKYKQYKKQQHQHKEQASKPAEKYIPKKQQQSTFTISRKVQSWKPQKLLCKRFNVLMPYVTTKQRSEKEKSRQGEYY